MGTGLQLSLNVITYKRGGAGKPALPTPQLHPGVKWKETMGCSKRFETLKAQDTAFHSAKFASN